MGLWSDIVRRGTTGECRKEVRTIDKIVCNIFISPKNNINMSETITGILFKGEGHFKILWPMYNDLDRITCDCVFRFEPNTVISISPASKDEIKKWMRLPGNGVSKRRKLKTENDVFNLINYVWKDEKLITI